MISLYQLFKILFGLIISGFILFVIIYFLSSYTQIQDSSQQATTLKNFLKTAGDVYTSGNSVGFDDFYGKDFKLTFDTREPEGIVSGTGKTPVWFPLFFSLGDEVFLSRATIDMGWWEFHAVEAMPRTRIIFNPMTDDWDFLMEIVQFLPDSEFFDPKITFGLCDGSLLQEKLCGGDFCEKQGFLYQLSNPRIMDKCTVRMPDNARLIIISPSCSQTFSQHFCLTPPNTEGVGNINLRGSQSNLLYKDPIDIIAAVIGGYEKDLYGNSGETLYEYKNTVFREELSLASRILANRALIVGSKHPQSSPCQKAYSDEDYYKNLGTVSSLLKQLKQAKTTHEELAKRGCDYQ